MYCTVSIDESTDTHKFPVERICTCFLPMKQERRIYEIYYLPCAVNSRTIKLVLKYTSLKKDIILEMERLWNLFGASTFIYFM